MEALRGVIEAIHSSPTQVVLYLGGGASQAWGWLMSVPRGPSATPSAILEVVVSNSHASMVNLLGRKVPESFASQETSDDLSLLAYNRALKLAMTGMPVLGIGFVGALASVPSEHGDHRCYLSARTSERMWRSHIVLSKGLRNLMEEDALFSQFLIKGMAIACKVPMEPVEGFRDDEVIVESVVPYDEDQQLQQLLSGQICMKVYSFEKGIHVPKSRRRLILSGSFNPLHEHHLKRLEEASWYVVCIYQGGFPCFEISAINADTPPLTLEQIKDRVKQFDAKGKTVIITNQPYFYKKAELLPDSTFVMAADTAVRIINPEYYGNSARMLEVLLGVGKLGCNFLVGGRTIDGTFKVLSDLNVPKQLRDMFISIPEDEYPMDISSTDIRESQRLMGLVTIPEVEYPMDISSTDIREIQRLMGLVTPR